MSNSHPSKRGSRIDAHRRWRRPRDLFPLTLCKATGILKAQCKYTGHMCVHACVATEAAQWH